MGAFVQKYQYYYTLSEQTIHVVTVGKCSLTDRTALETREVQIKSFGQFKAIFFGLYHRLQSFKWYIILRIRLRLSKYEKEVNNSIGETDEVLCSALKWRVGPVPV